MLKCYPRDKHEEVRHLGVAIRETNSGNCHAGIMYRFNNEELSFLHFETDHKLTDEPIKNDYLWVISGLNPKNQKVLATLCREMSLKNANGNTPIPYGFRFDGNYFDVTGDFVGNPSENGLTCATFILAVFRTFSFELLDTINWPRFGDVEDFFFQVAMTKSLAAETAKIHGTKAGDDLEKTLKKQHTSPRFRPEQVTAGARSTKIPLKYDAAVSLGNRILADVKAAHAAAKAGKQAAETSSSEGKQEPDKVFKAELEASKIIDPPRT